MTMARMDACMHAHARAHSLASGYMRQEASQTLSLLINAEENLDQQDSLQRQAVGTFGIAVLPKLHVHQRKLGGEQKTAVASFEEV